MCWFAKICFKNDKTNSQVRKQKQTGSVVDKKKTRDRGEWPWNHMITSKQVETGPARNMQRFESRVFIEN